VVKVEMSSRAVVNDRSIRGHVVISRAEYLALRKTGRFHWQGKECAAMDAYTDAAIVSVINSGLFFE
jgi:hypothetical protein